jgi:hypothetical protein
LESPELRNEPQSMRRWLFFVPTVKVTRKQSPSSFRRYIRIRAEVLAMAVVG